MHEQARFTAEFVLISCSCWDAVVLHVGMQLFLERVTREYTLSPLYGPKIDALL